MKKIILLEPELLEVMKGRFSPNPDPELISRVNDAMEQLEPEHRELLRMWYYEGFRMRDVARALDKSEKEITGMLYEARRQMKVLLADFVKKRWGVNTGGLCKICEHPGRETIEKILIGRGRGESWKTTNGRIFDAVNERFEPPQILKAHIRHMKRKSIGHDEGR